MNMVYCHIMIKTFQYGEVGVGGHCLVHSQYINHGKVVRVRTIYMNNHNIIVIVLCLV